MNERWCYRAAFLCWATSVIVVKIAAPALVWDIWVLATLPAGVLLCVGM